MNENQSSPNQSSKNLVSFVIYPEIKQEDFDLLIMYLESRKQSGGGDILDLESLNYESLSNKQKFQINYEDAEAKKRILKKKFFKFKNYFLKSLQPESGDLMSDKYDLNACKLIVNNILLSENSEEDDSIVRMYAEYLAPDNDLVDVQQSALIPNTFFITYNEELDRAKLQTRFNKKSQLRNQKVNLFDSFNTNSFLITSVNSQNSSKTDLEAIKLKVIEEIQKTDANYFVDLKDNYLLFQFENDSCLNQFIDPIKGFLDKNPNQFIIEYCHNFDLLKNYFINNIPSNVKLEEKKVEKKFIDCAVQTDFQVKVIYPSKFKIEKSGASSMRSSFSETDTDRQKYNSTLSLSSRASLTIKSQQNLNLNLDSDLTLSDSVLNLDPKDYYTTALFFTKQLFENFKADLKKLDENLKLVIDTNESLIYICNTSSNLNPDWKTSVLNELNEFFKHRALYIVQRIPNDIYANQEYMNILIENLNEWNKQSLAYFFKIDSFNIHCFGCKRSLKKKIEHFNDLFAQIKNPPNTTKVMNQVAPTSSNVDFILKDYLNINSLGQDGNVYEIDKKSFLHKVLINIKQIQFDFKNSLSTNINSQLIFQNESNNFLIKPLLKTVDKTEWLSKVQNYIDEYEKNSISDCKLDVPVYLKNPSEINNLINNLEKFIKSIQTIKFDMNNSSINVYGYTKPVEAFKVNALAKIKKLENCVKERIKTKLDLKFTFKKKPLETTILQKFNGIYFKGFSSGLSNLKTSIELFKIDKKEQGYKLNCLLNQTDLKNEILIDTWRNKLNNYINSYFSRFTRQIVKTSNQNFDESKLKFDESLVNIFWLSENEAEITGVKNEVNKIANLLTNVTNKNDANSFGAVNGHVSAPSVTKQQAPAKSKTASTTIAKSNNEETFLIKDLKWFQTKILFEKKYFQYITENFKDMKVMLDTNLTSIFFTGNKSDIEKAKKVAFDILKEILGAEIECDPVTLNSMCINESLYISLLKQNNLCCIIDSKTYKDRFIIYATDYHDIEACKNILLKNKF